jgi:ATP-binding cassette subfamily C protein
MFAEFKNAINVLTKGNRKWFTCILLAQFVIQGLDIVGLLLFTTLVMSFVAQINGSPLPNLINDFSDLLPIELPEDRLLIFVALSAIFFLLGKSFLSLLVMILIQRFLVSRENYQSFSYLNRVFHSPWIILRNINPSNIFFMFTTGMSALFNTGFTALITVCTEILFQILIIVSMILVSPNLAIISLLIFTALGFFLYYFQGRYAQEIGSIRGKTSTQVNLEIFTSLAGFRNLYLANQVNAKLNFVNSLRARMTSIQAKETIISQASKYAVDIFSVILLLTLCIFAVLSENKVQAAGILTFFVAATTRVIPSLLRIQNGIFSLRISLSTVKTIDSNVIGSIYSKDLTRDTPRLENKDILDSRGAIQNSDDHVVEFCNVTFAFPDSEKLVIDEFNLKIYKGEKVGIFGESGSGKSTLADLLVGLLKPSKGFVRLFGLEPSLHIQTKLELSIGYVPQEVPLFPETVYENLVLGDYTISRTNVMRVLDDLNLTELILDFPDGLETVIGPNGRVISGGQKQRLGIARALLRNPKLLILDEATSSLDPENEQSVRDIYENRLSGISLFVIAHKLSTLEKMDRLIVMERGRSVFSGSYTDFLDFNSRSK